MEFFRGFGSILRGGWRASPGRMALTFALMIVNYVSWPLAPLALKAVTDAVVEGDVRTATLAAAFLPLLALLNQVAGQLSRAAWVELGDLNNLRLQEELGDIAQAPRGLEHHERPDYADRLETMRHEGIAVTQSVRIAISAIALTLQLVVTVLMLALLQPLLLFLLLFAVPPLVGARWAWHRFETVLIRDADGSRRSTHLLDLAMRADAAKEIRIFGLEEELRRRLRDSRDELRRRRFRAEFEGVAAIAAGQLVFAFGYVGGLLLVVRGAIDGQQTVGDVILAVSLAAQTNNLVYEIVGTAQHLQRSARAYNRLSWLRDLVERLYPTPELITEVPPRLREGIRFEAVGFTYPGTETEALRGVDLHMAAGSTIAFVGENGAGKSTLMKLLCRFYEPTQGRITVDGAELAEIPAAAWRERIAAGFQDFVRFELLARESVGVGDLAAIDDEPAVAKAVERAAAADVVDRLADGYDTQLGKTYTDGAELSGGQWQKIALARAMMRERPLLLILDEPTSALDAHAEHTLFERYAESARSVAQATGGIAVFASHRFSTVRMADLIVVVDGGAIVEQGSHEELVARGGVYAELFSLQALAYG